MGLYAHGISSSGRVLSLAQPGATTREELDAKRPRLPLSLLGSTAFLKQQVILDVGGFDPRFDGDQDVNRVNRMGEVGLVLAVPEPLVLRRIHSGNYSGRVFSAQPAQNHYVRVRIHARQDGSDMLTLEEFLAG